MRPGACVDRIYLYVPPEERAEVEAAGAHWDDLSKCWYVNEGESLAGLSKWLPDDAADDGYSISSDEAYVAATTVACCECQAEIEVICIYCQSGVASDEPLDQFTVSAISNLDDALGQQLEAWPSFRYVKEEGLFSNHCPHCGARQDDMYLHSEPDQPFFCIPRAPAGSIRLTPLVGPIQLSGDESFEV